MSHKCDNCQSCKLLKKKLEIYERCMNDLKELEQFNNKNIDLEESIILAKDNDGNINKKIKSDLGESILIIDHGKNLDELNKIEQDIIKEQDNYAAYKQTKCTTDKFNSVYSAITYVIGIGKFVLFL